MPYYLTKILPLLLMPVPVALAAVLLALIFIARGNRKPAVYCLVLSLLVLWLSSLPVVASQLLLSLESQHRPIAVENVPASDCIVVLGGALEPPTPPRADIELTDSADRVYQAAKLYRAGKGKTIIVAAGNQPWARHPVSEAQQIGDLLVEWGVPPDSVVLDTRSKNTRENAINAAALIRQRGCRSSLLVTSAWHMPRALAAFSKVGADLFPVPVDMRLVQEDRGSVAQFIPRADALAMTSQALLEWMGIWVYRFRGWN